jgi:preprotein translocase subunit SecA
MAIEDRRVNKGIERAQKKVEERNFHIRKNLLEYDEVMDYQRKTFYSMRQQVVEGRGLSDMIWEMIDEALADALDRYYDKQYPADCAADWARESLGVAIDPGKLDTDHFDVLSRSLRDLAEYETRQTIQRIFGEYVDPDVDREEWDVRGLTAWAAQYGLSLTQNQVRKSEPAELLELITVAAEKKVRTQDFAPLQQYVDPLFAKSRLVRWAKEKFDVDVPLDDIATANREDAQRIIGEKMRAAYRVREIEYPVMAVIDYAAQRGGSNINEVYNRLATWARRKYGVGWNYDHFAGRNPEQVFRELRALNEDYLSNGRLDGEIDAALAAHQGPELVRWARGRFGAVLDSNPLDPQGDVRQQLRHCAYEMLRYELTQIERYVLLTAFDAVWKDHMWSMDLLKNAIHLRGYAEQDPKIAYKREGTRMFNEMLATIRERVTDLIFKVRPAGAVAGGYGEPGAEAGQPAPAGPATGGGMAYGGMTTTKADATGAGFSAAAADQQAAMRQQGEASKPATIRRDKPKVGRNDPCPCGSGKKYKHCHGRGV